MTDSTPHRRWRWAGQLLLLIAIVVVVGRQVARHWTEFRSLDITFRWRVGYLLMAVFFVVVTYALQIESWRRVLAGWAQRLPYWKAARIWWIANLGRYVPGKVWSVGGMVLLTQRAGVPVWLAGASTVALQAISLATCVALIAATLGVTVSPVALGAAGLIALAAIAALTLDAPARLVMRVAGPAAELRPLPLRAVLVSALLSQLSWATYGAAFWLLARGIVPADDFSFVQAAGIFALGYLLGFLALFAPGGIGVREIVYVGLLAPAVGAGEAIGISVASRLLLTVLEGTAGLIAVTVGRSHKEFGRDHTRA